MPIRFAERMERLGTEGAFEVLARAEEECLAYLYFTGLPGFDPIRADPRFEALLERLELPPASRAPS